MVNNMAATTPTCHKQATCHNHCHQEAKSTLCEDLFRVLEIVSLVALAVIAAYANPKIFFPFLGVGFILGVYRQSNATPEKEGCHHQSIGCSQGFFEQLTGEKLPPLFGLGVNLAIAYEHLDHHTRIFVPIIGLNAGIWLGKHVYRCLPV